VTAFPPPVPSAPASERVRAAYNRRHETDYEFTRSGWDIFFMVLCGIYAYYVFYRLMQRDRDHQRRSVELLDATNQFAWEQATAQGVEQELRPRFETVGWHLSTMREQTKAFRDPGLWVLIDILSNLAVIVPGAIFVFALDWPISPAFFAGGVATYIAFILIDSDYVRHDADEVAVQYELSTIFARLGEPVPLPAADRLKEKHNYAGRIVASIASCGIYLFWWNYDLMKEGNWHMYHCWAWEDGLAQAVYRLSTSTPPPGLAPGA
jgi:hypothetical protein